MTMSLHSQSTNDESANAMKRLAMTALVAAAAVLLTACSSGAPAENTSSGSAGGETLGVVAYIGTNAINLQAIRGATEVAEKAGWTVNVTDTQGNADQANAAITSYATQGVGGILVLVYPATALGAGLASAKAADVPVAIWGGGLADGVIATTSNEAVGAASAQALVESMGDEGDLLALTFHPASSVSTIRPSSTTR